MSTKAEEEKEIRGQRHDFIKEYYKMATLDLDRHLKAGWQTIAVLAGGAAILASGHEGKIGLPIATSIAMISAFWGALFVIDANYWSARAIGFLSNVESIYFSAEDRRVFNPYIGHHPPYKLLDSLRYMFLLCVLFGATALLSLLWEVTRSYPSTSLIWNHLMVMRPLPLAFWSFPILTTMWGGAWTFQVWFDRRRDYVAFTRDSPGPGVREKTAQLRHVTLEPVTGGTPPTIEPDSHAAKLTKLEVRSALLYLITRIAWALAITPTAILALYAMSAG